MNWLWRFGASYFGVRDPDHVYRDMLEMANEGLTFVVHTFSENDMRFYSGTMKEIVDISRKAGLEVYLDPWGVCGIFGGEAFSAFVCENPDTWQILKSGKRVPAACPNNPKTLEFLEDWVRTAVELSPTGIFFDEPHFYKTSEKDWACACDFCQKKFLEEFGYPLPAQFTEDVLQFRVRTMANLIRHLSGIAKDGGLTTSLCLLPREKEVAYWTEFSQIPTLDIIGTDPYWVALRLDGDDVTKHVKKFSRIVVGLAKSHNKEPQIWIQAFKIPQGTETNIRRAVYAAVEEGVKNIVAWSFKGTRIMSYIRPDRPEVVWETYISAIREIKNRSL